MEIVQYADMVRGNQALVDDLNYRIQYARSVFAQRILMDVTNVLNVMWANYRLKDNAAYVFNGNEMTISTWALEQAIVSFLQSLAEQNAFPKEPSLERESLDRFVYSTAVVGNALTNMNIRAYGLRTDSMSLSNIAKIASAANGY